MGKDKGNKGKDRDTNKWFQKIFGNRKHQETTSNPSERKGGESSESTLPKPQVDVETKCLAPVSFPDGLPTRPLQQQDKHAPSQLWKEAAKSLEQKDQEKLERIKSRQKGRVADTSPEAQRGSTPDGHAKDPPVDEVNLTLDRAKELRNEGREATWKPVSAISSRNSHEMHAKYWYLGH
jgi:hypothetical protein